MTYTNQYPSPLGDMLLTGDEEGLTGLRFMDGAGHGGPWPKSDAIPREMDYFGQAKEWLDIYFTGRDPGFLPKMHIAGTDFRHRVWGILCGIPFGKTATYGWIAGLIAKERGLHTMSAQAVGGAVGHNPVPVIIPCHRVMGAKGNLTGYGGGIPKKIALLQLEGVDVSRFYVPRTYRGE